MKLKPKNNGQVFVLMPFDEKFNDLYFLGIKETLEKKDYICERVDEQHFTDLIVERIHNQIKTADLIVGITTSRNPNVFYEIGYAHAIGKKVILISDDAKSIPFDLNQYPHIIYKDLKELKEKLEGKIEFFKNDPEFYISPIDSINPLVKGADIVSSTDPFLFHWYENVIDEGFPFYALNIFIDLENSSNNEFKDGLRIGLELPKDFPYLYEGVFEQYLTKKGTRIIISSPINDIFPYCLEKVEFKFGTETFLQPPTKQYESFSSTLHIFSRYDKKEFEFKFDVCHLKTD
ncbi:hypothetical protein [Leptospira stimsonii]|nr:hypothetical protein [Leptospira stimsonii]